MSKKLFLFFALVLALCPVAMADEPIALEIPSGITLRQGFVIPWENPGDGFMNMTTTTILRTKESAEFGTWNALWEGWSLDAAWSYDSGTSSVGLMVGRHLGTLGKYLPIDYPLADKIDITLYPIGFVVDRPFDEPEMTAASGAGIIKLSMSF